MLRFQYLLQCYIYKTLALCSLICHILTELINFEITKITPFMMIFERNSNCNMKDATWRYGNPTKMRRVYINIRETQGAMYNPEKLTTLGTQDI